LATLAADSSKQRMCCHRYRAAALGLVKTPAGAQTMARHFLERRKRLQGRRLLKKCHAIRLGVALGFLNVVHLMGDGELG
jgi:hypothetical protein